MNLAWLVPLVCFMVAYYMKLKTDMRGGPSTTHFKKPSKPKPETTSYRKLGNKEDDPQ